MPRSATPDRVRLLRSYSGLPAGSVGEVTRSLGVQGLVLVDFNGDGREVFLLRVGRDVERVQPGVEPYPGFGG